MAAWKGVAMDAGAETASGMAVTMAAAREGHAMSPQDTAFVPRQGCAYNRPMTLPCHTARQRLRFSAVGALPLGHFRAVAPP